MIEEQKLEIVRMITIIYATDSWNCSFLQSTVSLWGDTQEKMNDIILETMLY